MSARSVVIATAATSLLLGLCIPTYAVQPDAQRAGATGKAPARRATFLPRPSPPGSNRSCTPRICVHWITAAVDPTDANGNGVPDYVDRVRRTVDAVHQQYVAAGYRAPLPDRQRGGDSRTDVYIRNVGAQSVYGFCATDQDVPKNGPHDAWAFCEVDNDYAEPAFQNHSQLENIQLTAAREYFHAVQFAYDALEDGWFMQATARWAEDEVFDEINDNVQWLPAGPMGRPRVPLDEFASAGNHQDGDWIFFRFLTERFPKRAGGMPTLVRDMWRRADASTTRHDKYSLQAIRAVLAARGATFDGRFARFADGNRRPTETYNEGAANDYPTAPLWNSATLSAAQTTTGPLAVRLDHLSNATLELTPSGLTEPDWKLRIDLNMADTVRGSTAVVTEYPVGLPPRTSRITLGRTGAGTTSVPFSSAAVTKVEVTLVNASTRSSCGADPDSPYSCSGVPPDDNLRDRVTATILR